MKFSNWQWNINLLLLIQTIFDIDHLTFQVRSKRSNTQNLCLPTHLSWQLTAGIRHTCETICAYYFEELWHVVSIDADESEILTSEWWIMCDDWFVDTFS